MKKSYVFNTLICCGCTALIFLLHFIVYGGVLLKSPGYTGLFCAVWIAQAAGYSGTLEPEDSSAYRCARSSVAAAILHPFRQRSVRHHRGPV